MPQAMIVSLGGSPEPVIKTLSEHAPQIVCFLASQETVDLVGKVKEAVSNMGVSFRDYKVLVDNAEDITQCYEKALACVEWVMKQGVSTKDVIVDYTGGTKTMSAALVSATMSRGVRFSYVGGERRTKGGVGVVESGTEQIRLGQNPWEVFAVQERQRLVQYFNSYQFAACRTLIQGVIDRVSSDEKQRFEVLRILVEGYEAWERFKHGAGLTCLEKGAIELQKLANVHAEGFLASLTGGLAGNLEFLRHLKAERRDAHDLHPLLLSDLLANAKRRIEEGKFDDAAARLYRLVEMIGQIEMKQLYGAETGNFSLEPIPEPLREEFERRYRDEKDSKLKLPLEATYLLLREQGSEIGQRFFQNRGRFSNLQQARNQSILAHGVIPIEEQRVRELLDFVSTLVPFQAEPQFPKLHVE